jgi:hypothetical protein
VHERGRGAVAVDRMGFAHHFIFLLLSFNKTKG